LEKSPHLRPYLSLSSRPHSNRWITCENLNGGHVWETDPFNGGDARKTLFGDTAIAGAEGSFFESFAYDNSDPQSPKFFATDGSSRGALRRLTPDTQALIAANSSGDYSQLLHTNPGGTARVEYLLLQPNADNPNTGTFSWTHKGNRAAATIHAKTYYSYSEGLDIRNGMLYMTAKAPRVLMILDLVNETYERISTTSGAFNGQPDAIKRALGPGSDDSILYFCEETGDSSDAGVHGRDVDGNFFSVLTSEELQGETGGLAFSPDNKHMYIAYQDEGLLFDIVRDDGYPFGGVTLDIKYHQMPEMG
jgi:hypothetical protein